MRDWVAAAVSVATGAADAKRIAGDQLGDLGRTGRAGAAPLLQAVAGQHRVVVILEGRGQLLIAGARPGRHRP